MEKKFNLSEKLTIEGFRDDDWFNENILADDLDKNEIVELVLEEISKDVKEFIEETMKDIQQTLNFSPNKLNLLERLRKRAEKDLL